MKSAHKMEMRSHIQNAAKHAFAARSFEQVKIEEIARDAETSVGTIYNYFLNKDDLIVSLLEYCGAPGDKLSWSALFRYLSPDSQLSMQSVEIGRRYVHQMKDLITIALDALLVATAEKKRPA